MKQHITIQQWDRLTDKAKEKWGDFALGRYTGRYWAMQEHHLPTIGQLIEYLGLQWTKIIKQAGNGFFAPDPNQLCDELWNYVKEDLEK